MKKQIGERIQVLADKVLGTDAVMGTILEVNNKQRHYIVHCDGDDPEWAGPVNEDGHVLCEIP
jgi:hypothetical protein